MNSYNYDVSLRIRHPNLEEEVICKVIDIKPYRKWSAGKQRMTPKGNALDGVYEQTYCSFKLEHNETEELSSFLMRASEDLESKKKFLHMVIESGGDVEFFVGWYIKGNIGDVFDYELLKKISSLGISLSLDVYSESVTKK